MTPRLRRLLAILLLLLVVALVYHLGVRPIVAAHRDYDERIADMQALLVEFRRSSADLDRLGDALDELQRRPDLQTSYLAGDSEALVSANLQNVVKQTIEQAGGVLESTQILPAESDGPVRRIAVRVRMTGTLESLVLALAELEGQQPFLFVDRVDIAVLPTRRRRAAAAAAEASATPLRAGFEVFGYMRDV